jgi:hypothetical protein
MVANPDAHGSEIHRAVGFGSGSLIQSRIRIRILAVQIKMGSLKHLKRLGYLFNVCILLYTEKNNKFLTA